MLLPNTHTLNIHQSTLTNVEGNYYINTIPAGESGIDKLYQASCPDAFHDSQIRQPPSRCLEGTYEQILTDISNWISDGEERILWLTGPAGCGKSATAQTIAEKCDNLGASFFFSQSSASPGRRTVARLVPSIVFQLISRMQHKHGQERTQIGTAIENDQSILNKSLQDQFSKLLHAVFSQAPDPEGASPLVASQPSLIIIDGLDECEGDENQRSVVNEIGKLASVVSVPFRFLIVSRPEPHIKDAFDRLPIRFRRISLGDKEYFSGIQKDIRYYLRKKFDEIYEGRHLTAEEFWPGDRILETLTYKSGDAFIYASTVMKYIGDENYHPMRRLDEILSTPSGLTPLEEVDELYRRILRAHPERQKLVKVLTFVCLGERGLRDVQLIERLLDVKPGEVMAILRRCQSLVDVSKPNNITCHHKTFRDFIHDKQRAKEYFVDVQEGNAFIACELLKFLRIPARHSISNRTTQKLRQIAENQWEFFCLGAICWHQHPELLEEVSLALDSHLNIKPYNQTLHMLHWIGGIKKKPPPNDVNLLEIQYHLFKKFWETFMENIRKTYLHSFTVFNRGQGGISFFCWDLSMDFWSPSFTIQPGPLFERMIHEPGNLKKYNMNVIFDHTDATIQCLNMLQSPLFFRLWKNSIDYESVSWTSSLLDVPLGDKKMISVLNKFRRSILRPSLNDFEIDNIRTWLQSSGINPDGIWCKRYEERHKNKPYGTRYSWEIRDHEYRLDNRKPKLSKAGLCEDHQGGHEPDHALWSSMGVPELLMNTHYS